MYLLLLAHALAGEVVVVPDEGLGAAVANDRLSEELDRLGADLSVVVRPQAAGESPAAALAAAFAIPDVEYVVALGPMMAVAARELDTYPVPVVAAVDLSTSPPPRGLISLQVDVALDDAVATMERLVGGPVALVGTDVAEAERLGVPLLAPAADMQLPDGIVGLVVAPLVDRPIADQRALFAAWNARGIPALALFSDLDIGAPAVTGRSGMSSAVRRLALVLSDLDSGRKPNPRPLTVNPGRLSLSAPRLAELGLSPPFEVVAEANLVGWQDLWPPLSLDEAVAIAFENSPSLQATRATVAADDTAVGQAWSAWSPQVDASLSASQLDPNMNSAFQAETSVAGALTAQQLIYSDGARVNVRMQQDFRESRVHELAAAEQDLAYQVMASYIGLLRRRSLVELYRADLDRVRLSLDVARERQRVGDIAESDVARWESEIASTRANLTAAWVDVMSSTMTVNQLCGRPAGDLFVPTPTGEDLPDLTTLLTSPAHLAAVRVAAGEAAQSWAPVVMQLDSLVSARDRYARSTRRAYYMPTVAGQFTVNANVYQSELAQGQPPPALYWTAGGSVSLPLFEGMSRRATQRESHHDLAATRQQHERSRQAVAVQAMDAVNQAYSAATRARLGQDQVDAVHRSLEASLDAYARGGATLTTITEARTASLKAELAATDSRYEAIQRMYDVLYATGSLPTPDDPNRPNALRNTLRSSLEAQ